MSNLKRYHEKNIPYFVTTVTKDRKLLFHDLRWCRILLVTIEYHKTVFDYNVYGYCLMPDHLHLILRPIGSFSISFIMKMIKGSFARRMNKLRGRTGSQWQRKFYDEAIRSEKQLLQQLDYMHQNPVTAGLVEDVKDYFFSSYAQFHGLSNPWSAILTIDPIK
jgi:putative transposase